MSVLDKPAGPSDREHVAGTATPPDGRPRGRAAKPKRAVAPIRAGGADELVSFMSSAFLMVAVVALWLVAQLVFLGSLSQDRSQHLLYGEFRKELAAATAPTGPGTEPGRPVALISITKLSLQQVVVEGTASGDLIAGPGHRRDTVLPGQTGVSAIYGRANAYGAPFGKLGSLHRGDQVVTQTGQGRTVYTVIGVRRSGDPLPPPVTGTRARITLVSAEGAGTLGAFNPATTVYVDAEAPRGFAAGGGLPPQGPESEKALAIDTGGLPMVSLALALLLGLTAAVTWARRRAAASLIWVIASPIALALAWFTSDTVVRLLPNLL